MCVGAGPLAGRSRSCGRHWQFLQAQHTLEPQLVEDRHHFRILKERLMPRRLPDTVLDVVDEVAAALRQSLAITKDNGAPAGPSAYFYILLSLAPGRLSSSMG